MAQHYNYHNNNNTKKAQTIHLPRIGKLREKVENQHFEIVQNVLKLCPFYLNIDIYVVYIDFANIARIFVVKSMLPNIGM